MKNKFKYLGKGAIKVLTGAVVAAGVSKLGKIYLDKKISEEDKCIDEEQVEYERDLESQSIDDMARSLHGDGNYVKSRIYREEDYFDLETGLTNDIVEEMGEIFSNSEDFEDYKERLRNNPELQIDLLNDYYSYEEYNG